MDHDEPKQLKLLEKKDLPASRQGKREREAKANKWIVVSILAITIIFSLVFYFSGKKNRPVKPTPVKGNQNRDTPLGGQKVYQF